jgi:hypothetical protein
MTARSSSYGSGASEGKIRKRRRGALTFSMLRVRSARVSKVVVLRDA